MPFESDSQRKFMYAKHPAIAKRWSSEYPNQKDPPEYVEKKRSVRRNAVLFQMKSK